jgi:hypothetical protein
MKLASDPLLRRSLDCAWRAGPSQLGCRVGPAGSDREFPGFTARSGTHRARAYFGEHLVRRSGHIVQDRPLRSVCWTEIPQLSAWDAPCPAAWQQHWQQSRRCACCRGCRRRYPLGAMPLMLLSVVVRTTGGFGIWPSVGPMGGCKMAHGKSAAPGRRSRSAPRGSTQVIKANVATLAPLSVIRTEEPVTMRAGDWISLAGLVVSVIGFSVVIRELIRIAHVSETSQASHQVNPKEADPAAGGSSS